MTSFELFICSILIFLSACFSASEIALFSLSRFQLRTLKERIRAHSHRNIKRLLSDPGGLLITILFLNEVINIALSGLVAKAVGNWNDQESIFMRTFPSVPEWAMDTILGTLVTAPIVLLLCEITPKAIGARANQLVATLTANPLHGVYQAFMPVRVALQFLLRLVSSFSGKNVAPEHGKDSVLKEADFMLMVEEGHKEGAIHQSEFELIKSVFEFDDSKIEEILTPIAQVNTVPENTTVRAALQTARATGFSRIPVAAATGRKQIVGILYAKDLLQAKLRPEMLDEPIKNLMKRPLVVNPGLRLNSLFRKFKQQRTHMAVVKKSTGETLGVVTMSDVLDALFEDLIPEAADGTDLYDEGTPEKALT